MNLALNNLQWLMCHKVNQTKPNPNYPLHPTKCKLYEIYRRIYDVYGEACFGLVSLFNSILNFVGYLKPKRSL